ncbi:MAG TPA: pilus assembly protein PilM, partial [Phycisphaerae bacterium]
MLASIIDMFEKDFLTVDWDARTLRIVHAVSGKRVEIVDTLAAPLPVSTNLGNAESLGRLIRKVLDQNRIKTTRMIVDIPRDQVSLIPLTIPNASPNDLPSIVEFQVSKELPFGLSDAVIDFAISSEDAVAGTCDVLVSAVRKEVLDFYRQVAGFAGLELKRVGLRPYANAIAVAEVLRRTLPERVLFIDVGPALTEIDILRAGRLMYSRAASVAVPAGPAPAPAATSGALRFPSVTEPRDHATVVRELLVEVTRSIEDYRAKARDPGATIDHVVVGGASGMEDELAEALQKRLNATAETYNPATVFGWSPDEGANACAFAAALGLALGHAAEGRLQIDFLHPKRTVPRRVEQWRKAPLGAIAALLFIAAGVLLYFRLVRPQYVELTRIEGQLAKARKLKTSQDELAKLVETAESFDKGQVVWLDALRDLVEAVPDNKELVITRVDMSQRERAVTLRVNIKESGTSGTAVAALDEFRAPDTGARRFEAKQRQLNQAASGNYPYSAQI